MTSTGTQSRGSSPATKLGFPLCPIPLDLEGSIPADMVHLHVVGGTIAASIIGLDQLPGVPAEDYLIDRTEVTNEEYAKFVEAGGYQRRELWKQPFVKDGRTVPWEEAVALFRDSTGRPGPATWDVGSFPKGLEKHPVAGVSWYEAAAYAEFAGKSLPTVYHWGWAAGVDWATSSCPGATSRARARCRWEAKGRWAGLARTTWPATSRSGVGTKVRRARGSSSVGASASRPTCSGAGRAVALGPQAELRLPLRQARLAPLPCGDRAESSRSSATSSKEKPVSDEVFNAFKGLYAYDKRDLDARVEETVTTEYGTREKVSFNAAYGGERVIAYLFLPKSAVPALPDRRLLPGMRAAEYDAKFNRSKTTRTSSSKSGRALMYPLYKGTFERRDGAQVRTWPSRPPYYRDHMIAWSKDLGRSIDYLETRRDIDSVSLAYYGFSWGRRGRAGHAGGREPFQGGDPRSGGPPERAGSSRG